MYRPWLGRRKGKDGTKGDVEGRGQGHAAQGRGHGIHRGGATVLKEEKSQCSERARWKAQKLAVSPSAFSWELKRPTQSLGDERACVVLAIFGECNAHGRSLWGRALCRGPLAEKGLVRVAGKGEDTQQQEALCWSVGNGGGWELGRDGRSWVVGQGFILEAHGGTGVPWGPSRLHVTCKPTIRTLGSP